MNGTNRGADDGKQHEAEDEGRITMMESRDMFDLLQTDTNAWVEQADELFLSAKLVESKFKDVQRMPALVSNFRQQQLAFFNSFMMVTAFAFENLIKGLGVAKGMHWKNDFGEEGGHGIANYVHKVTSVSAEEKDLLTRLQVFSIWAGRYPMLTSPEKYRADAPRRRFSFSKDVDLIEALSSRLKSEIRSARSVK